MILEQDLRSPMQSIWCKSSYFGMFDLGKLEKINLPGVYLTFEKSPTISMIFITEQMLSLVVIWTSNNYFHSLTRDKPQDLGVS